MSLFEHQSPLPAPLTEYTISELSSMYRVSFRALRFYEDKQLLKPRRVGTTRLYSARDKVRLELVLTGKRLGFTLKEISELMHSRSIEASMQDPDLSKALSKSEIENRIAALERQRDDLRDAIDELRRAHDRFGAPKG